jgi:hypothetical protein
MNEEDIVSAAMPEMFRKLLMRELLRNDFPHAEYMPETGEIKIPIGDHERPPRINAEGNVLYHQVHSDLVTDILLPIAKRVKEIADAWNHSREMPVDDLPEFRLLSEYNNIVLAARDDTEHGHGLHFVTWKYDYNRTGMYQGHYTEDYSYAKEDFAVRAGLVPKEKLFTPEQAAEVKESLRYRLKNDDDVTLKKEELLLTVIENLNEVYTAPAAEEKASPEKKASIGEKLREGKAKSDAYRAINPTPAAKNHAKEFD